MLARLPTDASVQSKSPSPETSIGVDLHADAKDVSSERGNAELWFVGAMALISTAMFLAYVALALDALSEFGWEMLPFALMIGGLFYCALLYQVIRWGTARRAQSAKPGWDPDLLGPDAPSVTILIPSFQESRRVVIETVLSAALAIYRNKRIVVLVDDPPEATESLSETLGAIAVVRGWLREGQAIRDAALAKANDRAEFARTYRDLADWVDRMSAQIKADNDPSFAHVDRFVIEQVLNNCAADYRLSARRLLDGPEPNLNRVRDALACLATGGIESFQRKSFANLAHAPNKAMNLNAYLGLMGKSWDIQKRMSRDYLVEVPAGTPADLVIAPSTYVLTLDADSVILPDYILTLVGVLERTPSAAVAQTPYLTFPGGTSPVERIAGATTDIQYLIHQGSSHFGAAYWVGANAILRTRALHDIAKIREEGDVRTTVFIQDKTVIEDTGSTIDLHERGWHVHNHFVPMAYSATPADFGALAIQRKRWANGGLILFLDLLRCHFRQRAAIRRLPRLLIQTHYLLSPAIGNVGILGLMLLWTSTPHAIFWTPLFMVPYFLLYMADLERMGYRWWDLFGVSSLNLILLPVNLAGIGASLWQMVGGRRHQFIRTPKLPSRSFIPPYAFIFNLAILMLMVGYVVSGLRDGKLMGTIIPMLNVVFYTYGIYRFVGIRDGFSDLSLWIRQVVRLATRGLRNNPAIHTAVLPSKIGSNAAQSSITISLDSKDAR